MFRCCLTALLLLWVPGPLLRGQEPPRHPVPLPAAVDAARELITSVYKREYDSAKSSTQKLVLAKKMLDDAAKTGDDPAARFALQQVARKVALGVPDVDLAMTAVEATVASFQVDGASLKQEVLSELAPLAKTPLEHQAVARYVGRELPPLLQADQYKPALALTELALVAANKGGDADQVKQWTRRQAELQAQSMAYTDAQAALQTLNTSPADPTANATAGKFLAFYKQNWAKGLTMLALGSDVSLQALAERELKGTVTQAEQMALADDWYELAKKVEERAKTALLEHAGKHYERLLPALSALPQRRVQQHLEEIRAATSPFPKDEWVEILDYVEFPKHQVENTWRREGLAIVTAHPEHCKVFKIPVIADGSYELRVRAARMTGDHGMMITLSQSTNDAEFWLNSPSGGSGLQLIDSKGSHENRSRAKARPLGPGRTFILVLQVDRRDDAVSVNVTVDNQRYVRWTGPVASLKYVQDRWRNAIYIGACHTTNAVYSVQVKVKSGSAWLTE